MRTIILFINICLAILWASALGAQTLNPPNWANGYINVPGGATVNTIIINRQPLPNNLNILAQGAITTWNITLPNPAFDGQLIYIGCPGGNVATINISTSDGSTIAGANTTSCTVGVGIQLTYQFNQPINLWQNVSISLLQSTAVVYADLQPGADWCAKVTAAEALLPSTGGIVDARGLLGAQNCAGGLTVTNNAISILLGATTLSFSAPINFNGAQFLGVGTKSTILIPTFPTGNAFTVGSATALQGGAEVGNFSIIPPNSISRTSGANLAIIGVSDAYIHDVKSYYGFDGITIDGTTAAKTYGVFLDRILTSNAENANFGIGEATIPATAAWTTSNTTISVISCPANVAAGSTIWDMTLAPAGTAVGTFASCSGTTLTLQASAAVGSSGSSDWLRFSSSSYHAADIYVTDSSLGGNSIWGVEIANATGVHFKHDDDTNSATGLGVIPGTGQSATVIRANDFEADTPTYNAMLFSQTGTGVIAIVNLEGGWAATAGGATHANPSAGIIFQAPSGPTYLEDVTLNGVLVHNNGGHGIDIQGGSHFIISGQVNQNSETTNNTYCGIHVAAGVSDWSFYGNAGIGSQFGTLNQQSYGVCIDPGTSTAYSIIADLSGNQTGELSDGGTGTKTIALASGHGNAPRILGQSTLPFILPSSGTMGNNGALSLTTALPYTPFNAYVYLPLGAISSGSAAGWYFAQFSSATAGTVYNNVYTSGTPAIPTTPTAFVTTGPGAYTQTTGTYLPSYQVTIQANLLGLNGSIEVTGNLSLTTTSNNKGYRLYYGGQEINGGYTTTSPVSLPLHGGFSNRGQTNIQVNLLSGNMTGIGGNPFGPFITSVDSTVNQTLAFDLDIAAATDFMILEAFVVRLEPSVP